MPAKSAPSLLPTSIPLPAGSGSTFTLHHAHTPPSTPPRNQSARSTLLLPLLLTHSLLHVTLAFFSGINAPTSDTIPEGCSRGCSIRSGPVAVRQSPCMAPMAYRDMTVRLCTMQERRTALSAAPSACHLATLNSPAHRSTSLDRSFMKRLSPVPDTQPSHRHPTTRKCSAGYSPALAPLKPTTRATNKPLNSARQSLHSLHFVTLSFRSVGKRCSAEKNPHRRCTPLRSVCATNPTTQLRPTPAKAPIRRRLRKSNHAGSLSAFAHNQPDTPDTTSAALRFAPFAQPAGRAGQLTQPFTAMPSLASRVLSVSSLLLITITTKPARQDRKRSTAFDLEAHSDKHDPRRI